MDRNTTKDRIQRFIEISNEIVKSINSAYDFLENPSPKPAKQGKQGKKSK